MTVWWRELLTLLDVVREFSAGSERSQNQILRSVVLAVAEPSPLEQNPETAPTQTGNGSQVGPEG